MALAPDLNQEVSTFYRELLIKYIHYVDGCEGTDFLDYTKSESFTDQEWNELQALKPNYPYRKQHSNE